jgi:agmatinase
MNNAIFMGRVCREPDTGSSAPDQNGVFLSKIFFTSANKDATSHSMNGKYPSNKVTHGDGPPSVDAGYFGISCRREDAAIWIVPVPLEVTVSYRTGTAEGPRAIWRASHQLDLLDMDVGDLRALGITTDQEDDPDITSLNHEARVRAAQVMESLAAGQSPDARDMAFVNQTCENVNQRVQDRVQRALAAKKIPVILGGDHSVAFGGIRACMDAHPGAGVLQVDAHADLRLAYEGFTYSHASVFRNLLELDPQQPLTQVGVRDFCQEELDTINRHANVSTFFDRSLRKARMTGNLLALLSQVVSTLPSKVYISFDIDGLQPNQCPRTGTPVPGGLSFDEAVELMEMVVRSGRTIVGLDLCEVSGSGSSHGSDTTDAIVGARLCYKLIGFAAISQGLQGWPTPLPDAGASWSEPSS